MKQNLLIALTAVFAVALLAGCGNDTSTGNPKIDKLLDKMQFHNSPTFGKLCRTLIVKMHNKDWEGVWDMMDSKSHDNYEKTWKTIKDKDYDKEIKQTEKSIENTQNEEVKKMLENSLKSLKEQKKKYADVNSGKEYYIALMKISEEFGVDREKEAEKEEIEDVVSGEKFSDDEKTGWIMMKNKESGEEKKGFAFTKEDGEWKFAMYGENDE